MNSFGVRGVMFVLPTRKLSKVATQIIEMYKWRSAEKHRSSLLQESPWHLQQRWFGEVLFQAFSKVQIFSINFLSMKSSNRKRIGRKTKKISGQRFTFHFGHAHTKRIYVHQLVTIAPLFYKKNSL